ncbi:hypothetical protein AMAG_18832 [Allomyces macrogynus ATCC 38327]|uniref:Uncharacterized protein n=1 Tax=Allomyces macrogynus (strain ATCC 38327) TaxID=578462 RepID=A0A0L0SIC1_ALLM3|nr:hypothetical protein AMAG_18832 [Allomyces macrogynus ATCC 38327]|eukprot:KNE62266.1 hypothetical protein AMAG_18832 [Allomyces macrogynus ATCC 38327]
MIKLVLADSRVPAVRDAEAVVVDPLIPYGWTLASPTSTTWPWCARSTAIPTSSLSRTMTGGSRAPTARTRTTTSTIGRTRTLRSTGARGSSARRPGGPTRPGIRRSSRSTT